MGMAKANTLPWASPATSRGGTAHTSHRHDATPAAALSRCNQHGVTVLCFCVQMQGVAQQRARIADCEPTDLEGQISYMPITLAHDNL